MALETLFRGTAQLSEAMELREPASSQLGRESVVVDAHAGATVHRLRLQRDWSQAELASRAGVSHGTVQSIESATKSPTLRTLDALARAFDLTVRDLLSTGGSAKHSSARVGRR